MQVSEFGSDSLAPNQLTLDRTDPVYLSLVHLTSLLPATSKKISLEHFGIPSLLTLTEKIEVKLGYGEDKASFRSREGRDKAGLRSR